MHSVHDARVVSGRDESIQRLRGCYERIHARLWRAVFVWSGSRDVTDDAVAEALAQAVRRAQRSGTLTHGCGGRPFASPRES